MEKYHKPVLLKETLEFLDPHVGGVVVDATFGFGGHSKEILKKIGEAGKLVAIDQDKDSLELAKKNFDDKNIEFVNGNFRNLTKILVNQKINKADAILADLGLSSYHYDTANRGFSFSDQKLDMRLDRNQSLNAYEIVNSYNEKDLADLLYEMADEFKSRRIAKAIVEARRKKKVESAEELAQIIVRCVSRSGKIHPATKTFQALRIAVNDEINALNNFLNDAVDSLKVGGRLVIISFHSGEDRIVKNKFKEFEKENKVTILTKKPVTAHLDEIKNNHRSRSAKLRALRRI